MADGCHGVMGVMGSGEARRRTVKYVRLRKTHSSIQDKGGKLILPDPPVRRLALNQNSILAVKRPIAPDAGYPRAQ